ESDLVLQLRRLPCFRHTRRAFPQYPDLESNQDLDLRRVQCDPLQHRDRFKSRRRETMGVRGELNPPPRLSQSRMPDHYTTNTICAPTRSRTRNTSIEARDDFHFTIRAQAEGVGFEPTFHEGARVSSAARPTVSGYLPNGAVVSSCQSTRMDLSAADHRPLTIHN